MNAAPLTHTPIPSCADPKRPACLACTDAADRCIPWPCEHAKFTVHFTGGPWDGKTYDAERIVAPVFAVGHLIGNHYYLDTKSEPPTYFWDGTEWETVDG